MPVIIHKITILTSYVPRSSLGNSDLSQKISFSPFHRRHLEGVFMLNIMITGFEPHNSPSAAFVEAIL